MPKNWLIWKDPDAEKDWEQEEKGTTEDEIVGWHHRLNGHGFGWTLGVGDGQGGLARCGSWSCKESDTTEWLNWTGFVTTFLPRSKDLSMSWLQSPSTVIWEKTRKENLSLLPLSPHLFVMKWWDQMPRSLFYERWVWSQLFHSLSPSRDSIVPLHFLPLEWYHLHIEVADISPGNLDSILWFIQPSISHDVLCI